MSIYANNKLMSNCKIGDKQVSKIVFNDKTIWENWTGPYSSTKEDPDEGAYRANAGVSWRFSAPGIKLIRAYSNGYSSNEEYSESWVRISTSDGKYNNTVISKSSTGTYVSTTWTGTIENVTYVSCSNEGTVNKKNCVGGITYYQRGS